MSYRASFWVSGEPQPKGSFRAITVGGRPTVIPDNKRSKAWERAVKVVASTVAPDQLIDAPIRVSFRFVMPSPKKPRFPCPATKPDWDKLSRSTGDALTGVIYTDDARVIGARVDLEYGDTPGAEITVEEVDLQPQQKEMF